MLIVCGSSVCWLSLYCLISVGMSVVVSDVFDICMVVLLWDSCFLSYWSVNLPGDFAFNIRLLTFSNKFFKSSLRCIYSALNSKSYIFCVLVFLAFPLVFLVCQYFCAFFLYMTMTAVYYTCTQMHFILSATFHVTKTTKYWYKTKTQSSENFKFYIPNLFYTVSAYLNLKKLGQKKFTTISRPSGFQSFHRYCIVWWIIVEVKWEFLIHTAHTEVSAW